MNVTENQKIKNTNSFIKNVINKIFGDYPVDEGYKFDVNAYEVTQDQFN
jgi:hypothetical protein